MIGLIQESQVLPTGEAPPPPSEAQTEWFLLNIDAVQPQMPYELLPVVRSATAGGRDEPPRQYPVRDEPLALDEGSHFSYAIQWFMFAAILGVGYLLLIQQQEARSQAPGRGEAAGRRASLTLRATTHIIMAPIDAESRSDSRRFPTCPHSRDTRRVTRSDERVQRHQAEERVLQVCSFNRAQ